MVQNLICVSQSISGELSQLYDFFNILADCLGFGKGALFVNAAGQNLFMPYCRIGFNDTTCLNWQMDSEAANRFFSNSACRLIDASDATFQRYFSTNDLSTIEGTVCLLPVSSHQKTVGMLLITNCPYLELDGRELDMIVPAIQTPLRQLLENHLKLTVSPYLIKETHGTDLVSRNLAEIAPGLPGRQAILVRLDRLVGDLAEEFPCLLPAGLRRDLSDHASSLVCRHADLKIISDESLVFVLSEASSPAVSQICGLIRNELAKTLGMELRAGVLDAAIAPFPTSSFSV